ncbi:MAG: serine/threonine protein kinase [Myxococcales bacterium]|nr:serine/threonine protein kinase [Myxococcales bacterium]
MVWCVPKRGHVVGSVIGRYRLLELLGRGGMSVVYLAEHTLLGKKVAIKLLHDEYSRDPRVVARFVDEARAAALVRHPGIVDIHDFGRHDDGRAFLVMERLDGESLARRLHRDGPLPERLVVDVLRQSARALAATHAAGVIHRDLKPANLFLERDATQQWGVMVKVLDFGVCRLSEGPKVRLTLKGAIVGTPAYMAPEQCKNARDADPRADVYALGCIAFEMAVGRPPFIQKGMGDLLVAHATSAPPLHLLDSVVSSPLRAVIARMLAKAPDARPQSMTDVDDALATAAAQRDEARSFVAAHVTAPMEAVVCDTIVDGTPPEMLPGADVSDPLAHGRHRPS